MKKMFISIIIPAYNEEKYLPFCLDSLRKQTYPKDKFEIIVVDNSSIDETKNIAEKFRCKIIVEKQRGYVYALKRGMDQASGEIIAVTDADCKVPFDWLEKIARVFEDETVVALTGGATISQTLYHLFLKGTFGIGKPNMSGFNCAVREDVYKKSGGLDVRFTMSPDVDLGLRLKKYGKVIYIKDLIINTSNRRFKGRVIQALLEYGRGYIYSVWLRRPPPVRQAVIR